MKTLYLLWVAGLAIYFGYGQYTKEFINELTLEEFLAIEYSLCGSFKPPANYNLYDFGSSKRSHAKLNAKALDVLVVHNDASYSPLSAMKMTKSQAEYDRGTDSRVTGVRYSYLNLALPRTKGSIAKYMYPVKHVLHPRSKATADQWYDAIRQSRIDCGFKPAPFYDSGAVLIRTAKSGWLAYHTPSWYTQMGHYPKSVIDSFGPDIHPVTKKRYFKVTKEMEDFKKERIKYLKEINYPIEGALGAVIYQAAIKNGGKILSDSLGLTAISENRDPSTTHTAHTAYTTSIESMIAKRKVSSAIKDITRAASNSLNWRKNFVNSTNQYLKENE